MRSRGAKLLGAALTLMIVASALLAFGTGTAAAADSDFVYTTSGSTATITGYVGAGGAVDIPATLDGHDVVAIGDTAFYAISSITSVTIPEGVVSIGAYAFYACTGVTSITIPASVTSIGILAFSQCSSLTAITVSGASGSYASVEGVLYDHSIATLIQCPGAKSGTFTVPSSVTAIGESAFESCTRLTSVSVPAGVGAIGDYAFSQCSSLSAINVARANTAFSSADGVLYNEAGTVLLRCPSAKSGALAIPAGVATIAANALGVLHPADIDHDAIRGHLHRRQRLRFLH